jgi:YidC/Oxa1 family membrane protein insertase
VWRVPVPQGASSLSFELFAGPKQLDLLRTYGRDLDTVIDYGAVANLFAFIARLLFWLMRWFHGLVHNWGVAIMLLTLTVRLVLYPLTVKQMHSMQRMKELQPEIEKLKQKFGADREKLNQATMQLYQEKKVNPASGCLPILIQMPIWFALYATLQTSVELYREPFLWIQDLTRYDPFYVLPLAMGATMFVTQKLAPQPADSTQAKILLYFMPGFFTFLMLRLPAGLALYILFNNLLSIVQQQYMLKKTAAPAAPAKG